MEFPAFAGDRASGENCPYCGDPVNREALYCRSCSRLLVNAQLCPFCREPILKGALKCRYCASPLSEKELAKFKPKPPAEKINETLCASPIGAFVSTFSLTAILFPPELQLTEERVHLRRWTFFGLRVFDQEIPLQKIASVRLQKGIIWSELMLETHGGAMADLSLVGLDKEEAQAMMKRIRTLTRRFERIQDD